MKRKIAAIFAADIAGYSRLVAEDEEETLRRLAAYRQVTDDFIAKRGGRLFKTPGDAGLARFSRAGAAFSPPRAMRSPPISRARGKPCAAPSTSRKACAQGTGRTRGAGRWRF